MCMKCALQRNVTATEFAVAIIFAGLEAMLTPKEVLTGFKSISSDDDFQKIYATNGITEQAVFDEVERILKPALQATPASGEGSGL